MVNSNFYDITDWATYLSTTHKLPNISRIKVTQTIKFDQLIEYIRKNILLRKSYTKCGGKASPRPFYKK